MNSILQKTSPTVLLSKLSSSNQAFTTRNFWSKVPQGPEDSILGITVAFRNDPAPVKLNLGVGAYRDDNGKPYILKCVRQAEERILKANLDMEYLPIGGLTGFNDKARDLLFGKDHAVVKEKRVTIVQTLSGTGSLRLGGEFLNRFLPESTGLYAPNPTWANHHNIFRDSHRPLKAYAYYEPKTCGLNFEGMVHDLQAAPDHSAILLHTCAHNPTGVDPTPEQWQALVHVFQKKKHLAYFDTAYQGFATGDLDRDAYPVRLFSDHNIPLVFSQSFAKNFGLYGHRVGTFGVVTTSSEEAARVESQLKILIRPIWSNPPLHGARVVDYVLNDPQLAALWKEELRTMSHRIIDMREKLYAGLQKRGSSHNWQHILDQIGMFCYTGLKPDQVDRLTKEFHVYLTRDGRISMVGLTNSNVDHLANAIHEVTK